MKPLAILATALAVVLLLAAIGCALGGIWTDADGQVDPISWHLWCTAFVLIPLAIASGGAAAMLWENNSWGDDQ